MNCPNVFLKYGMCFVNTLFVILGIALIAVGTISLTRNNEYESLVEDGFYSVPALLITLGVFVTILFFFGCWGLKKESYWLLMTFAVLLGIILVMEVAGGISAYVLRDKTEGIFNSTLEKSFDTSYNPTDKNNSETQALWTHIQPKLECCGVHGPKDYGMFHNNNSTENKTIAIPIPDSCCNLTMGSPPCNTSISAGLIYSQGCQGPIVAAVESSLSMVAKWALLVAFLHLLWIIGACHLAITFRRNNYESV